MMFKFKDARKQNQKYLLKYLEGGNLTTFNKLLERKDENNIDPNHEYSDPYNKTCLAIASEKGKVEFIKVLLDNNADPNLTCKQHNGNTPIHFAAKNGHVDAIKCLVEHRDTNVRITNKHGETALHLSARGLTENKNNAEKCFSYLASLPGMSVSHKNARGLSAISEAVEKCSTDTFQNVLQRRDLKPEDRKLILDNHPELKDMAPESTEATYTHVEAYMDLRELNLKRFRDNFKEEFVNETDLIEMTFLQRACKQGLPDIVKYLLSYEADVNKTGSHESKPPVYLACYYGQCDVLKSLLNTGKVKVELIEGKTLLHTVLEGFGDHRHARDRYRHCFDYLMEENKKLNIPINHGDNYGHTALHYAVQEDYDYFTKALLAHGAYIGSLNDFDICPLNDIDPKTLETALNGCVDCIKEKDNEYTLKFDYSILNPAAERDSERTNDAESEERSQEILPEMFPLYFISQSNKFGHLLKHPVLLIFLNMKWKRIQKIFYLYLLLYFIFVILLTLDILSNFKMCGECSQNSECYEREVNRVRPFLIFLSVVFVFVELMLFCMLPEKCRFFCHLENCLKVCIIITTVLILVGNCSKILAAATLLLAWTEVSLRIGCFDILAIHNEMLKRVTVSYMKFFLWYAPLIAAFTFSFYMMYHNETSSEVKGGNYSARNTSSNFSVQDNSVDFYSDLRMSLLKTVVMIIGELDASSMTFDHGGYFLFLFFVFMMTIVFMNLLNGLAVSDTQAIKNDAKLVTYKSRVKLVHHFESVAFGGPVHGRCGYKPVGQSPYSWCVWQEKLLRAISLFPGVLPHGFLDITVNEGTQHTERYLNKYVEEFRLDVLVAAKDIADKTRRESEDKSSQIENRLAKIEENIQGYRKQFETLEGLLEKLMESNRCYDHNSHR